ncbi:MAG: Rrf2 family transcriptional regulator [Deltaproteobacteria bacterium]|nr:Rrf2 family transcriptional regulator [Deltaproteobacteria bacterium]
MAYPTRVRYGLRLLVRLALQDDARLSMSDIAQEEGVSIKYLEQIVGLLKPLGILESVRGAHGGYRLVDDPAQITMDRVFESLGGLSASAPCFEDAGICERVEYCTTKPFWGLLDEHVRGFLRRTTLADVVASAPKGGEEFRHSSCPAG